MFRISLIVCISLLIYGIAATPYKTWNKVADAAFQDTIMTEDQKGEMSLGLQVEPPQDMDVTDNDIDPSMAIWKSMKGTGQDGQYLKAEEDMDELYHPQLQNQDPLVPQKEEQDNDEMNRRAMEELVGYLAPLMAQVNVDTGVQVHMKPEDDVDDLYHADPRSPVQGNLAPLEPEVRGDPRVRVHVQPEEDMDDLYHADQLKPIPSGGDADESAQVHVREQLPDDRPSQRKYSQPEEDMDDFYHN
ncbi:uncharacterized protein ACJ7VT_016005 isoform 1-T4 [Polymixia lowei]